MCKDPVKETRYVLFRVPLEQGILKSETVGLPSDKARKKAHPHPLSQIYLVSFAQSLDAYGIMIMLFDPIDTKQLILGGLYIAV